MKKMIHDCNQADKIAALAKNEAQAVHDIKILKADFDEHRSAQRNHEEILNDKLERISVQMMELIDTNNEIKDIKTAWRVGSSLGFRLAGTIAALGIITAAVYSFKEWIRK